MPSGIGLQASQFTDPVLRGSIRDSFNSWNAEKMGKEVWRECGFEELDTDKPFEEFTEAAGLGLAPRQATFQNAATDIVKQGLEQRINQYLYGLNMPVDVMAQKSKDIRKLINGSKAVAESLYNSREILHADLYANMFASAGVGTMPDAQPIVGTSGKLARGGTMDNLLSSASFSETSIEAAFVRADKMPGGHNIPVGVSINRAVIPADYQFDAIRIFKSQNQSWNANNAINALRETAGGDFKIVKNRFLASSSNWFLLTDAELGFLTIWMQKPDVEEVGMSMQKAIVYYGSQILGVGCVNRRKVIASNV